MEVSIIIATKNAARCLGPHLEALWPQVDRTRMEVIVVDASPGDSVTGILTKFSQVQLLSVPPTTLVPEMWSLGLRKSNGGRVAIFSAHVLPEPDWLKRACTLLDEGCDGVAGTLDPCPGENPVQRAWHYCRYARYMSPLQDAQTWDLPGDAVAYRREALFRHRKLFVNGFWEPTINRQLVADGGRLRLTSLLRSTTIPDSSFGTAMSARFRHGYRYARDRKLSPGVSAIYVLLFFFLPVVLFWRCMVQLQARRVSLADRLSCSPWLFLLFCGWSLGETGGYLKRIIRPEPAPQIAPS